jgi:hypothetical protein
LLVKTVSEKSGKISYPVKGYYPSISSLLVAVSCIEAFDAVEKLRELDKVLEHTRTFGDRLKTPLIANLKEAIKAFEPEMS